MRYSHTRPVCPLFVPLQEPQSGFCNASTTLSDLQPNERREVAFVVQAGKLEVCRSPLERTRHFAATEVADLWQVYRTGGRPQRVATSGRLHWSTAPLPPGCSDLETLRALSRTHPQRWQLLIRIRHQGQSDAERAMLAGMLDDLERVDALAGWSAEQRMMLERIRKRALTSVQHLTSAPFLMDAAVLAAERLPERFGRDLSRALTGSREALQVVRSGEAAGWTAIRAERSVMTRLSQRFTALELERVVPPFA